MECSDLTRTGVAGLDGHFIINIDHHAGNRMYGAINWFDESAAACGEMVFDIIKALGVPLSQEIATHIYLAILTDTGSFHHSNITPRTFEICRQTVEAGVNPAIMARRVYDSNSFGKLKLIGALLDEMQLVDGGRLAVLRMDDAVLAACGCTQNDTEGIINLPLTAREIQAVVFFKTVGERRASGSACGRSTTSTCALSQASSAAAATRTPPASPSPARSRTFSPASSIGSSGPSTRGCRHVRRNERRPRRRQAVGPDLARRGRRACGGRLERRRVGHTGTLDPLATGVLPLVIGRATRLAQFLSSDDKEYVADVRSGSRRRPTTRSGASRRRRRRDAPGRCSDAVAIGGARRRSAARICQMPPAFSAKKVVGQAGLRACAGGSGAGAQAGRGHGHARSRSSEQRRSGPRRLRVVCSSGFYVRTLAHELGRRLGCGAHSAALRRTRAGTFTLADAVPLDVIERAGARRASEAHSARATAAGYSCCRADRRTVCAARCHGNVLPPSAHESGLRRTGRLRGAACWTAPGSSLGIAELRARRAFASGHRPGVRY